MKRFSGIWGVAAAALLTLPLNAQLAVRGDIIKQLQGRPGKVLRAEIIIENSSSRLQGGSLKLVAINNERDLTSWIKISTPYFNLPAKSAIRIRYKIHVPKDVKGSYWTKFILSPTELKKTGMVKIRTQLAGFIILDLPGGKTGLTFEDMKYENSCFHIDVRNSGTIFMRPELTLYADGTPHAVARRLCFPGQLTTWRIPVPDLRDGTHSIVVIATEPKGNYGTRWDLNVGTEAIRKFVMFIPIRFSLSSDIGPRGLASLARVDASIDRWRIGAGGYFSKDLSRINFNLSYYRRTLGITAYTYLTAGSWRTSLSATLTHKKWLFMIQSEPFQERGNLDIRYQFNRGYLGARATVRPGRFDWLISASLPFDFQLKFKRKIKRERAKLETIIFQAKETN